MVRHRWPRRHRRSTSTTGKYWVFRRPHERAASAPLARQSDKLEHWLVHHWIAPAEINGIRIQRTSAARGDLGKYLALIRKSGSCKVFVVSFTDGVEPEWTKPEAFVATGLTDEDERWKSVKAALAKAVQG